MTNQELYEMAVKAREFSYSPYSNFKVGAALLAKNGTVYTGCNIENVAFGPTVCAERVAFFKAISDIIYIFFSKQNNLWYYTKTVVSCQLYKLHKIGGGGLYLSQILHARTQISRHAITGCRDIPGYS